MSRVMGFSDCNIFGMECMEGRGMLSYEGYFENEGGKAEDVSEANQDIAIMKKNR